MADKMMHPKAPNRTAGERNEFNRGFRLGEAQADRRFQDGKTACRDQVLNWLEVQYMKKDVARGSERGSAILQLTRELAEMLKAQGI